MASSDVPPNSKRSADYLESPASTSKARAVHVMEVNQQDEQGGPSNRSGCVLANDQTTKPWAWNPWSLPPERRGWEFVMWVLDNCGEEVRQELIHERDLQPAAS